MVEREKGHKLDGGGDSVERLLPPESGLKLPALNECTVLFVHSLMYFQSSICT